MKVVGEELEKWAYAQSELHKKDLFGRSAFNRYYYAAFLITRDMLSTYNVVWKRAKHAGIPDLLEGEFMKPVINRLRIDAKKNRITESEMKRLKSDLLFATTGLANLLREAYSVRVIADYEPETAIASVGKVISLNSYKLNSASNWASRASSYCKTIHKVWRDVGLA